MAVQDHSVVRPTLMSREVAESPAVVERQLHANQAAITALGARLRSAPPAVVVTCARGSSDHAATYAKYLIETLLGVPVASAAPSVSSIYASPVQADRTLLLAISQSGGSPDLLTTVEAHRAAGALVVALVNDPDSPLAQAADLLLPLHAGTELAVAATKSCIAAMAALVAIVVAWSGDEEIGAALTTLPQMLREALTLDWSAASNALRPADRMFVLGRGYSFGIAQEAALKLKETCAIQAEPFSSAEVRHGPMRIVDEGFQSSPSRPRTKRVPTLQRRPEKCRSTVQSHSSRAKAAIYPSCRVTLHCSRSPCSPASTEWPSSSRFPWEWTPTHLRASPR